MKSLITLSHAALERNAQELLGLNGEFHGKFVDHIFGVTADNEGNGVLGGDTALVAVEQLVLGDFRSCGFVFHCGVVVGHIDIRERVRAAGGTQQQGVARGIVACAFGLRSHFDQSAIGILAVTGGDTFRDDRGTRVAADGIIFVPVSAS